MVEWVWMGGGDDNGRQTTDDGRRTTTTEGGRRTTTNSLKGVIKERSCYQGSVVGELRPTQRPSTAVKLYNLVFLEYTGYQRRVSE